MNEFETYFVVAVAKDGSVKTMGSIPEDIKSERAATAEDVFRSCKDIVEEIEAMKLAERLAIHIATFSPAEPSDRVREALNERGVTLQKGE